MPETPATNGSRIVLGGIGGVSIVGAFVWALIGSVRAFLMFAFNDVGTPAAQLNAQIGLMMIPALLLALTAGVAGFSLIRPTPKRVILTTALFALTIAVLILVPPTRAVLNFIVAIIEQAS